MPNSHNICQGISYSTMENNIWQENFLLYVVEQASSYT